MVALCALSGEADLVLLAGDLEWDFDLERLGWGLEWPEGGEPDFERDRRGDFDLECWDFRGGDLEWDLEGDRRDLGKGDLDLDLEKDLFLGGLRDLDMLRLLWGDLERLRYFRRGGVRDLDRDRILAEIRICEVGNTSQKLPLCSMKFTIVWSS